MPPEEDHLERPESPAAVDASESPFESIDEILARLRGRLEASDADGLAALADALTPGDFSRAMGLLDPAERIRFLDLLAPVDAAALLDNLPDEHAADLLEEVHPGRAAAIVSELDSDDRADVLAEMELRDAQAILEALPDLEAEETRQLLSYPADTAGGVMVKEFIAYPTGTTVDDILDDLRDNAEEYASYSVQYFYVTDMAGALRGVLRLRDMVLAPRDRRVEKIMIANPAAVTADTPLGTLQTLFEVHSYVALPVVDNAGRLLGVVQEKDAAEAARKSANRMMLQLAGIFGGDELRSQPLGGRVSRRVSWLFLNLILNLIAASVIAIYQDTLAQAIMLAVFLPIISDMSGCSGQQAVGLSLRELALGVVRTRDLRYVIWKELQPGMINALIMGLLLGAIGGLWHQNLHLGLVLAGAMGANTLIAVVLGGGLPLMLKRVGMDPAIAAAPILTTITDMCGFFLVLQLATAMLGYLK